ncbi:MAG: hypothetical protein HOL01_12435 [Planctomycetaceae bacterium]|jgi:hypothetical protein|nr:hypothetical protein [Planctomycetaceae bacterium]MBT6483581.1 hypothetical protein [Planctomycetaceae bacterium]MBT6495350.1 hypothetical protein [Planctomycetaceae bacterium]
MTNRNGKRSPKTSRRCGATSLIEVIVMMSVGMVILGIAMTTIHLLLRAERHTTQAVWHNTTITRLSRVLRDDVHAVREAAVEADDDDGPANLVLTADNDRRIVYTIEEHELKRTESIGETVKRRNSFFLPVGSSLQFAQVAGPPSVVRLEIERATIAGGTAKKTKSSTDEPTARRTLTIESIVGRDHRFERAN